MRLGCPFCKGRHSSLKAGSQEVQGKVGEESTWPVLLSRSVEMPCFKQLWPLTKIVLQIWLFKGKFLGQNKIVSFAIFNFLNYCFLGSYRRDCRTFSPRTYGPGDKWSRKHLVQGTHGLRDILFR